MAAAISSLPVPDSPVISTLARDPAIWATVLNTSCIARRAADDVVEAVLLREPRPQQPRLGAKRRCSSSRATTTESSPDVDRLGEVVAGAGAHGADGGLDLAERGHHDDRQVRIALAKLGQQLQAVHPGHLEVREHQVGREVRHLAERLEAVGGRLDDVALVRSSSMSARARVDLVVDDQNSSFRVHSTNDSSRSRARTDICCGHDGTPSGGVPTTTMSAPISRACFTISVAATPWIILLLHARPAAETKPALSDSAWSI